MDDGEEGKFEVLNNENLFHRKVQFRKALNYDSSLFELQQKYTPLNQQFVNHLNAEQKNLNLSAQNNNCTTTTTTTSRIVDRKQKKNISGTDELEPLMPPKKSQKIEEKEEKPTKKMNNSFQSTPKKKVETKKWDEKDARLSFDINKDVSTEWSKELDSIFRSKHTPLGQENVTQWDDLETNTTETTALSDDSSLLTQRKQILKELTEEEKLRRMMYPKRERDDIELDKGRLKKVKQKKESLFANPQRQNMFQILHEKKKGNHHHHNNNTNNDDNNNNKNYKNKKNFGRNSSSSRSKKKMNPQNKKKIKSSR